MKIGRASGRRQSPDVSECRANCQDSVAHARRSTASIFPRDSFLAVVCVFGLSLLSATALGQLAPEIGYVHPSGARAGSTIEVLIGGYDWTPDMQLFAHDPRIKLELIGPPTPVLVPEPPYWFGAKGRGPAWPLSREFRAKLVIPADVRSGIVSWQAANANGSSPVARLHVSEFDEVREEPDSAAPQKLSTLPVVVSGQIRRIEEIDRYEFRPTRTGPLTIELFARRLGSPLHGMLSVRDAQGRLVLDAADTEGHDLCVTLIGRANEPYVLSLHDADFAGDRSYVYRLQITSGPQVLAAYPAGGRRGETRSVEFVGIGVATGSDQLESVPRDVAFPNDPATALTSYVLETPFGKSPPLELAMGTVAESTRPAGVAEFALPEGSSAVTGAIATRFGAETFVARWKKGEKWRVAASSSSRQPLDVELTVFGPDGKELATLDDLPGSTDAALNVTVAVDGEHRIVVNDRSGRSGSRAANYRLLVEPPREDFAVSVPAVLSVPLGGPAKLLVKIVREGGFAAPVKIALGGVPAGVTAPAELIVPADKSDLSIDLTCAADAPVSAALVSITARSDIAGQPVERSTAPVLTAIVMKPRFKITPEGLDDVRKVNRGSTFLAPLLIERLEGYAGDIVLEMTSKQQRHRQGLASDEFTIAPSAARVEYPIFVPEWMETTKTSRMILNGTAKVLDPRGTVRTLVQRMELRIGILPQGALMKLNSVASDERQPATRGGELRVPVTLVRAAEFRDPARIELVVDERQAKLFQSTPIELGGDAKDAVLIVRATDQATGDETLKFRATALQNGQWRVMSETTVDVRIAP